MTRCFFVLAFLVMVLTSIAQGSNRQRQKFIDNAPPVNRDAIKGPSVVPEPPAEGTTISEKSKQQVLEKRIADSTTHGLIQFHPVPDSVISIGLMLPFDCEATLAKIYSCLNETEVTRGDFCRLKEHVHEGLDFYQGLHYAAEHTTSSQKIRFFVYDTQASDSVVQVLLQEEPGLKKCQIIIGPSTIAGSKIVTAWCAQNHIINIQPFTAAKSIGSENEWLVRFMPTIDAHLQREYEMVIDSFADRNIVIYTTHRERDMAAARQLDTLFRAYNAVNINKLHYILFNSGDSSLQAAKKHLSYYLPPAQKNVLLMATYDEAPVNSILRTIKDNTVVFGMPTWLDADQLRPDYLNSAQPYITDNFYLDSINTIGIEFKKGYKEAYSTEPTRYAYMGYDGMNYLLSVFDKYGFDIIQGLVRQSYDGLGYSFHISPVLRTSHFTNEIITNYYSNTAMHLFQIRDYHVYMVR